MKTKELIKILKGLPQEADVYFDDFSGGLHEVAHSQIYGRQLLKRIRPDLETPVVVLTPVGGFSKL